MAGASNPNGPARKRKLSLRMTLRAFDNGYWYAAELREFGIKMRIPMAAALKAGAVSLRSPVRTVLVAAQIALALTLLVGAGLVARSAAYIEGGGRFDPSHVVLLRLRPRLVGYAPEQAQAFQRTVVKALESLPGVISLSLGGNGFVWEAGGRVRIALPTEQATTGNRARSVRHQEIGSRLFETLRVPLVRGRDFDDRDRIGSPRVAIVSESLAHSLWPDATALDRTILVGDQPHRVVGVVKDYQLRSGVEGVTPILYVPYWQNVQQSDSRMCVRVADDPEMALPRIKAAIERVDPNVPITETMPLAAQVRSTFVNVRLARSVLLGAGGLALLLSAIGLYGVVDFMVGRRRREIGIRMAVGARPEQILWLFLKQGLTLASIGGAAGLLLTLVTLRLLASFLYGVKVRDPVSILSGIAILLAVASLAAYLPARRAALLDPVENLRAE
jgi:predicted permease